MECRYLRLAGLLAVLVASVDLSQRLYQVSGNSSCKRSDKDSVRQDAFALNQSAYATFQSGRLARAWAGDDLNCSRRAGDQTPYLIALDSNKPRRLAFRY
jgi:hypothetical protein